MSLHRYLPPEEVAALSGHDRAKYAAERPVFAAPGSQAAVRADVGGLVTAPAFPPPDASALEVALWHETQRRRARSEANRWQNSTCTSCGQQGHRMGARVCANYGTPNRWVQQRYQRGGKP